MSRSLYSTKPASPYILVPLTMTMRAGRLTPVARVDVAPGRDEVSSLPQQESLGPTENKDRSIQESLLDRSTVPRIESRVMVRDPQLGEDAQVLVVEPSRHARRLWPGKVAAGLLVDELAVLLRQDVGSLRAALASVAEDEDTAEENSASNSRKRGEGAYGFPEAYCLSSSMSLWLSVLLKRKSLSSFL